jgi:hypothetical protein
MWVTTSPKGEGHITDLGAGAVVGELSFIAIYQVC